MIIGAHSILYSTNPEADREFLRDTLKLPHVDVGHGWLIFGLPPAEVAVHPGEENDVHEFYLMCDDAEALVVEMAKKGVSCTPIQNLGWGLLTQATLPGGGKLGIYQPRHGRPKQMTVKSAKKPAKKTAKRGVAKSPSKKSAARKSAARKSIARGTKSGARKSTARGTASKKSTATKAGKSAGRKRR